MRARRGWHLAAGGAAGGAVYLLVRGVRAVATRMAGTPLLVRPSGRRSYRHGVTVNRPPDEVYRFWRDVPRLARAVQGVLRIEQLDDRRSRWAVDGPRGATLGFTVEIVTDTPGQLLSWESVDSPVPHKGRVEFAAAPGGRGTELRAALTCLPPAGVAVEAVGWLAGDGPDALLRDVLRRVKQVVECGEVVRANGMTRQANPTGPVEDCCPRRCR